MPSVRREPPASKVVGPVRLVVTVVDGDRNLRVRSATVRLWNRQRAHRCDRRRRDRRAAARRARRHRRRARLRDTHGQGGLPGVAESDAPRLPAGSPVADVRRDRKPRADADAHSTAAAVSHRVVARARHVDRVPRRSRGRRRVHRQRRRDDPRHLDAHRPRAVASRHAVRTDGVVARGRRPGSGLPLDERPRDRARPRDRKRGLAGRVRLADRVVADRRGRRRLLRRVGRSPRRARPAHEACALDALPRREDHVERRNCRRSSLHRRLRRTALGSVTAYRCDAVGELRQRPHLRNACRAARPRVRAVVDRRLADGVLDERAATSGASIRARMSTRRRLRTADGSSSARTTACSTP